MKKFTTLLLALLMVFCVVAPVEAATKSISEDKLSEKPIVTIESNVITTEGNRYIKFTWNDIGAKRYIIQIADNSEFNNAKQSEKLTLKGTYYNFTTNSNKEGTYYIRVCPQFEQGKVNKKIIYVNGQWSDIVIAKYTKPNWNNVNVENIKINLSIPKIDWGKINWDAIKNWNK